MQSSKGGVPPSEGHEAFAKSVVERLGSHPDLVKLPHEYRWDVLFKLHDFIIEQRVSSDAQLRALKLRQTLEELSDTLASKKAVLLEMEHIESRFLVPGGAVRLSPAVWDLRKEIYNDLQPRLDALKLLNDWIYSH